MLDRQVILQLSLIEGIGPITIMQVIACAQKYSITAVQELITLSIARWQAWGFSENRAQKISAGLRNTRALEQELLISEREGISWLTIIDPDYPALLKEIHAPPPVLYWYGAHPGTFTKTLAIVGSRKATSYSRAILESVISPLCYENWCLVSGGARGADTMVHELALNHGSPTIAVLGSGLLKIYPKENEQLFTRISQQNGTVLSPFSLTIAPKPENFPARNRVIAGLSSGCLVLQAAQSSGARITAAFALEQGRNIGAVPGPFDDPLSAGCHALIMEGAQLITTPEQARELGGISGVNSLVLSSAHQVIKREKGETEVVESTIVSDKQEQELSRVSIEKSLVGLCRTPSSFDYLQEKLSVEANELYRLLVELQLQGLLEQNFMGLWQAC